jgi:hypothetical protein
MKKNVVGFLVTCCLVPALYAGCTYYIATNRVSWGATHDRATKLAFLIALPVALSCVVQWWDVWFKPLPKLGAFWAPMPPSKYLTEVLLVHGGVVIVSIVLQLATEQKLEFGQPNYDFAQARARLDKLNEEVRVASERLEPFRQKARDQYPYNYLEQDTWLDRFPEAIAFQKASKERYELRGEIAREEERARKAKPDPLVPLWPLFFGVFVSVVSNPMQSRRYSGHPIPN